MNKISKKLIAIMLTFVFVLSLVPFSASAEVIPANITGNDRLGGYTRGGSSSNEQTFYRNPNELIMRPDKTSNAYKAYLHYNISDYIKYLDGKDTSIVFSIQHSSVSGRQTRSYDIYLLKGDHVDTTSGDAPQSMINMKYAMTKGIVNKVTRDGNTYYDLNPDSTELIPVDKFTSSGTDSQVRTWTVDKQKIKDALGNTGWITFILNGTGSSSKFSQVTYNAEDTKLIINYDPSQAADEDDILGPIADE
ncbi:MAG: hypothetical protein J6V03_02570, partial [Clostridia bacterium]|nr:hypothetical protein [Clostridia bacterium]